MDSNNIEKEVCNNCKKEIPQQNYVMHTMHCARNITLCKICNEPIPKIDYETHREKCRPVVKKPSPPPPTLLENSVYFQERKAVEDKKVAIRRETYLRKHEHLLSNGYKLKETVVNDNNGATNQEVISKVSSSTISSRNNNQSASPGGAIKKPSLIPRLDDTTCANLGAKSKGASGLLPCKYCDLELAKLDLEEHEDYCGSRTDKCLECGELVMFKNKQFHWDSNHAFSKKKTDPTAKPSWDSSTQRSASTSNIESFSAPTRRRFNQFRLDDVDYDPAPYLPAVYQSGGGLRKKNKEGETYKEISRRLDCKTEYIRNLLHDSASITIPLRSNATAPRNYFNHDKGPSPQPPQRRRNPPTELTIPCEFCDSPIPHDELIEHETGCRPDLARFNPRRSRNNIALEDDDDDEEENDFSPSPVYEAPRRRRTPPRADSPDSEELPCEFCSNMVPASQLWRHQLSCTSAA